MSNLNKFEALDRIHTIQIMMYNPLVWDKEEMEDGFHNGLSEESKELVGKAMDLMCNAYQTQGISAFEDGEELSENQRQGGFVGLGGME